MSAASSTPPILKLVQCLSSKMFYILVWFWSRRLSRCTFCTCYQYLFAIAIDFFFAVTPRGLVDGSLYHLYYPTCFSPSYHWTVYTELASAMKRLPAVLLGFLAFVASLNIEYTTMITNESFFTCNGSLTISRNVRCLRMAMRVG